MASWMGVSSVDNFFATAERGFSIQGFKTRQRKKVMEQMAAGDRLVYYVTKLQVFAGTVNITSEGFEDHEPIWKSKPGEDYPWRAKVSADVILREADWVPSSAVAPGLTYVQKWPAEHWKLAFQGNLHLLPDEDFEVLRGVINSAAQQAADSGFDPVGEQATPHKAASKT